MTERIAFLGIGLMGAPMAERQVVLLGAAIVAVTGDQHLNLRILREPSGLTVQSGPVGVGQGRLVERVEHAIADVGDQVLLAPRGGTGGGGSGAGTGGRTGGGRLGGARRQQGNGGKGAEKLEFHWEWSLGEGCNDRHG